MPPRRLPILAMYQGGLHPLAVDPEDPSLPRPRCLVPLEDAIFPTRVLPWVVLLISKLQPMTSTLHVEEKKSNSLQSLLLFSISFLSTMLLSIGFEKYKAEHDSIFFYFSLTAVYPLVGTRVLLPSVSSGGFGALPCPS